MNSKLLLCADMEFPEKKRKNLENRINEKLKNSTG